MTSAAPKPMPNPEEILEQALRLPKEQRLRLADRIFQSVEDEGWPADVHPSWKAEIARRLKSIKDATAVLIDGEEHLQRLRDKYGA
jgi:putative addiction module component (TIGR02574 family)